MAAADAGTAAAASTDRGGEEGDGESACSTPFVSAPSSPTTRDAPSSSASFPYHGAGGFFSAPTSPTRGKGLGLDFDFDFSSRFPSPSAAAMSSADELFHNGQIRPVPRLSAILLQHHQQHASMAASSSPPLVAVESVDASGEREHWRVRGGGGMDLFPPQSEEFFAWLGKEKNSPCLRIPSLLSVKVFSDPFVFPL